jgi:hypothetical protein
MRLQRIKHFPFFMRSTTRPRLQRGWATYAFTTHQTLSFFHALATRPRLQRGWAIYAFATHQTLSFFHAPFSENKITKYHIKQYDFELLDTDTT